MKSNTSFHNLLATRRYSLVLILGIQLIMTQPSSAIDPPRVEWSEIKSGCKIGVQVIGRGMEVGEPFDIVVVIENVSASGVSYSEIAGYHGSCLSWDGSDGHVFHISKTSYYQEFNDLKEVSSIRCNIEPGKSVRFRVRVNQWLDMSKAADYRIYVSARINISDPNSAGELQLNAPTIMAKIKNPESQYDAAVQK